MDPYVLYVTHWLMLASAVVAAIASCLAAWRGWRNGCILRHVDRAVNGGMAEAVRAAREAGYEAGVLAERERLRRAP